MDGSIYSLLTLLNQQAPWQLEIQAFEAADKIAPPGHDAIAFVSSSSFALWEGMQEAFPASTSSTAALAAWTVKTVSVSLTAANKVNLDLVRYTNDFGEETTRAISEERQI